RVHLPDMGQELVPESLARARTTNDARDVNDPQGGWNDFLGLDELIDRVQAGVGDGDDADVGLDGGEWVVRGEGAGGGEGVEEGALADVGKADDSDFQGHRAGKYRRCARRDESRAPVISPPARRRAPGVSSRTRARSPR